MFFGETWSSIIDALSLEHEFGEDCFHLVVDCFKSKRVWKFLQGLVGGNVHVECMRGWWSLVKYFGTDMFQQANLVYCAWLIWKDRNASIFEGKCCSAESIVRKAMALVEERIAVYTSSPGV